MQAAVEGVAGEGSCSRAAWVGESLRLFAQGCSLALCAAGAAGPGARVPLEPWYRLHAARLKHALWCQRQLLWRVCSRTNTSSANAPYSDVHGVLMELTRYAFRPDEGQACWQACRTMVSHGGGGGGSGGCDATALAACVEGVLDDACAAMRWVDASFRAASGGKPFHRAAYQLARVALSSATSHADVSSMPSAGPHTSAAAAAAAALEELKPVLGPNTGGRGGLRMFTILATPLTRDMNMWMTAAAAAHASGGMPARRGRGKRGRNTTTRARTSGKSCSMAVEMLVFDFAARS
jgi:hypothetical protein